MKKLFVPYELALKLNELGFNEECVCGYDISQKIRGKLAQSNKGSYISWDKYDHDTPAPTFQQVIDWFRTEHNLHLVPIFSYNDKKKWSYHIIVLNIPDGDDRSCYLPLLDKGLTLHYELEMARDEAILKAIEIIEKRK
jgi:hypothetical protein